MALAFLRCLVLVTGWGWVPSVHKYFLCSASSWSCLSQYFPRAKSHLVIPTSSPLGLLHCPLLGLHKLCGSVLITPDQVPWASPICIRSHSQNPGWNAP